MGCSKTIYKCMAGVLQTLLYHLVQIKSAQRKKSFFDLVVNFDDGIMHPLKKNEIIYV